MQGREITAAEAAGMTRAQAIAALQHSPHERDRRVGALLAAGPVIDGADVARLHGFVPRLTAMSRAVGLAMRQMQAEAAAWREAGL